MVVPVTEDPNMPEPEQLLTNSPETPSSIVDDLCTNDFPRRKKMFSSSSFYEEPNAIYPTVEEQVEMCRKIAGSLSDVCNKKSRGANMFFKRVKKAEKWVVESNASIYESETSVESSTTDPSKMPYVKVGKEPPRLKLILDPRHIVDMKRLKQEGVNIVEHNAVSPEMFHDLLKDLNSPKGKGAQLFAKRKKKSEEWVVDEEKVKAMLRDHPHHNQQQDGTISSPEPNLGNLKMTHPRVQMLKTPWEAAMESPVGSCDSAFRDVDTGEIAETVIRAAEAKVMTYPSPRYSAIEPLSCQYSSTTTTQEQTVVLPPLQRMASMPSMVPTPPVVRPDAYRVRTPRGWMGGVSSSSCYSPTPDVSAQQPEPTTRDTYQPSPVPSGSFALKSFPPTRTYSFANFNATARAWTPGQSNQPQKSAQIKPVRPPSVLII